MARTEARIMTSIWKDGHFRGLTMDEQGTFSMLLSQPDLTHVGVIALRMERWANLSADEPTERIEKALVGLEAKRYIVTDRKTGELLIRSLMRRDGVYRQPNILKAAARALDDVESLLLRHHIAVELDRIAAEPDLKGDAVGIVKSMRSKVDICWSEPLAKGSANPSTDPLPNASRSTQGEGGGLEGYKYEGQDLPPVPATPSPGGGGSTGTNYRAREAEEPPNNEPAGRAEKILTDWRTSLPSPIHPKIMDQVSAVVVDALRVKISDEHVAEGLRVWQLRGNLGVGLLANFIHEVSQHVPSTELVMDDRARSPGLRIVGRPDRRESTTDARVDGNLTLVEELEAEEARR